LRIKRIHLLHLNIKLIALNQRFYSLDVFRGATVCLMILVNNPGTWSNIFAPLEHAPWHGCTPTDLVFPFFLFAVGNAMSFVMPKLEAAGNGVFWRKILKRTALIFLIGLFLNWSPFFIWLDNHLVGKPWAWIDKEGNFQGVRILGVLQRIALCYFFASILIYYLKARKAFYAGLVMLLVYWAFCFVLGSKADPYSMTGYFGTNIDISILHKYHMLHIDKIDSKVYYFDYEGLTSTIAAIVQVIFGYIVGDYIQKKGKTYEMLTNLFIAGVVLVFTGFCWDMVFPINKKIWTSSYAIYTTGLAIMTIATLIYLIEFKNIKGWWSKFFDVFGKNPLFIFVLSGFLPRVLGLIRIPNGTDTEGYTKFTSPFGWFYENICKTPFKLEVGSLLYAICMIVFYWAICYWLDKKKIYIKV
jgi:predicted acyltransferase